MQYVFTQPEACVLKHKTRAVYPILLHSKYFMNERSHVISLESSQRRVPLTTRHVWSYSSLLHSR